MCTGFFFVREVIVMNLFTASKRLIDHDLNIRQKARYLLSIWSIKKRGGRGKVEEQLTKNISHGQ